MEQSIWKIDGKLPGKTVAVFAGIHGDEKAGVLAVQNIINTVVIHSGTVYFVLANTEAIKRNVQQIKVNMNRVFNREIPITEQEHVRANELMDILDNCDALLDLHSSGSRDATSFIICSENGLSLAPHFDFSIVSTGWGNLQPGATDSYMKMKNTIGITLECGSSHEPEASVEQAEKAIYTFLELFGIREKNQKELPTFSQERIDVIQLIIKETDQISFTREYADFEDLEEGEIFATDGEKRYTAKKNEVIIFPRPNKPIGGVAGIIGKRIQG